MIKYQLVPASDGVNLFFRTDANNGASFDSGASDYANHTVNSATSLTGSDFATDTEIDVSSAIGNATNEGVAGTFWVEFKGSGTRWPHFTFSTSTLNASTVHISNNGAATRRTAAAIDAIQILFSSGNIASGTVRIYGISNA